MISQTIGFLKCRFAVTAVNAEARPTRLKLFRNYTRPRSLLEKKPEAPDDEFVWSAARATGAAPTFFKPYKQYLDGAIISNNPTLDLITEITEYNAAMKVSIAVKRTSAQFSCSP